MFVIDASVTLARCFADETSPQADRVLERLDVVSALAPARRASRGGTGRRKDRGMDGHDRLDRHDRADRPTCPLPEPWRA